MFWAVEQDKDSDIQQLCQRVCVVRIAGGMLLASSERQDRTSAGGPLEGSGGSPIRSDSSVKVKGRNSNGTGSWQQKISSQAREKRTGKLGGLKGAFFEVCCWLAGWLRQVAP